MLVGVCLDPRRASATSNSAESGNYENFVVVQHLTKQWPHNSTFSAETGLDLDRVGPG